jgi:hypothetical protein
MIRTGTVTVFPLRKSTTTDAALVTGSDRATLGGYQTGDALSKVRLKIRSIDASLHAYLPSMLADL